MKKLLFCVCVIAVSLFFSIGAAAVPGDINGDGTLSNDDLSTIIRHLSGHGDAVKLVNLDVDGDGRVNNRDAVLLAQALADWNVTMYSGVGRDGTDIHVADLR